MLQSNKKGKIGYVNNECNGGHLSTEKYHAMDYEHGGDCDWCVVAVSDQQYWVDELNKAYAKGIAFRDSERANLKAKIKYRTLNKRRIS